jgi:hypothetical protein
MIRIIISFYILCISIISCSKSVEQKYPNSHQKKNCNIKEKYAKEKNEFRKKNGIPVIPENWILTCGNSFLDFSNPQYDTIDPRSNSKIYASKTIYFLNDSTISHEKDTFLGVWKCIKDPEIHLPNLIESMNVLYCYDAKKSACVGWSIPISGLEKVTVDARLCDSKYDVIESTKDVKEILKKWNIKNPQGLEWYTPVR